ncbi:exodeoxyribonuclease III [Alkalicaulis satelles]|uniref:Exodeoxyribonuclease III n=1 Tax=Alkalicaulis satelles TaxID=2609175 RepID=A0A5M6ZC36_9PROT|nr:exodeoxyribonuclease III [Alkalicaulis satelles]KAA5802296.1 exodeoxyribonuclease III [Alkalicaulis satelles]
MRPLTLASWNVNSVRLRAPQIARFADMARPDVICLQEIKCLEDQFPHKIFADMGYPHAAVTGQKGMHGVAVVSRLPIEALDPHPLCPKDEARQQRVKIEGVEILNLYIPAGGDEPDPDTNPRFRHKLDFLGVLETYLAGRKDEPGARVLTGDLNIAPLEHDVWSHKQLLKVISHTPVETEALERLRKAGGWTDAARALIPEPEKLFTWWSYRNRDWRKSNRGRRLDHIWVNGDLEAAALSGGRAGFKVWEDCRDWPQPSDHAPVTLELR